MSSQFTTPVVTEMQVIPVAGHDSMLMNLSGAHAPFFTRNIVIIKDNSGHTGVGGNSRRREKSVKRWKMRFRWWWVKRWVNTKTF
ncbi:glucarate dehydratase [Escherichia coli]|uniref:Glucarate dehydratase n=1 Tax=Escherichia coli TaxID=562 RepID=A0A484YVV7_ECOLX|nr:glucarate dehydratase [Escherichia coli]